MADDKTFFWIVIIVIIGLALYSGMFSSLYPKWWTSTVPNPTNLQVVNNGCPPGEQPYNNVCFQCNPQDSYLQFDPNSNKIFCNQCSQGFKVEGQSCISIGEHKTNSLNLTLDKMALSISMIFGTNNLMVGYSVLLLMAFLIISYFIKKK